MVWGKVCGHRTTVICLVCGMMELGLFCTAGLMRSQFQHQARVPLWEHGKMAKRKRNTAYDPKLDADEFRGFLRHSLTKQDKQDYMTWTEKARPDLVWDFLAERVDSFYVFSIKHDSYGGGVMAALTDKNPKSGGVGIVLTARAPDVYNAVMLLVWKANEVFPEEWNIYFDAQEEVDVWG